MQIRTTLPCVFLLVAAVSAYAQQYDLRTYGQEEGLPSASVNALCEDQDGFLWVATEAGAARSEGSRFEHFGRAEGMPSEQITAVTCTRDGSVWFGTKNGEVAFFKDGRIFAPTVPGGFPRSAIRAFQEDARGDLWWATAEHGIVRYDQQEARLLGAEEGLPDPHCFDLIGLPNGMLLVATANGLASVDPATWRAEVVATSLTNAHILSLYVDSIGVLIGTVNGYEELDHDLHALPLNERFAGVFPLALKDPRVLDIIRARNGDLWLGTPAGMAHFSKENGTPELRTIGEANGLGHDLVYCVHQDRSGAVWAGTGFGGLSKFMSGAFIHFTSRDGLGSQIITAMHRTPDGLMWFGTFGGGISRWDGSTMRTFGLAEGLSGLFVQALDEDRAGRLLIGTATKGGFRWTGERIESLDGTGLDARSVNCFHRDPSGGIWAGTRSGLYRDPGNGGFTKVGLEQFSVNAIASSSDSIWITTDKGLFHAIRGAGPIAFAPHPRLPRVELTDMQRDNAGNLWIGTVEHGMYRVLGNRIDSLGTADGLEAMGIEQVLLDKVQNVWLGSRRSITYVELDELQERILQVRTFGPREGFVGIETTRNGSYLDSDGALWFGTVQGATRFDPDRVVRDPNEPLLHLTDLQLFYEHADWSPWCRGTGHNGLPTALELPHNKNHLTFAFTGISLAYPERVRYRWILEGYDPDWSPITATSRVTYSNIPPGEYTFKVMARNSSGIWTEDPEKYAFVIAPPFWDTYPFRIGGGSVLLLGLFGFIRLRERNLRRDRERLENTVTKRTAELATEKDRSDALLRNILPASTAEELKTKGSAEAQRYEQCSVLFSDFKGFTTFSGEMDSDTLVSELDHYFRLFDTLCDEYGVEKIKTIGDAYMCATGIPEPQPTHGMDAVLMGLAMIEAVEGSNAERRSRGDTEWPIRIGIHSGPVITGVVGRKKFAYDVWGNTVNLASRMESNGEAGRLNISGTTYAQVMEYIEVLPRGPIKVKGKGELNMYFVLRLKPEYSADTRGLKPNDRLLTIREQLRGGTKAR